MDPEYNAVPQPSQTPNNAGPGVPPQPSQPLPGQFRPENFDQLGQAQRPAPAQPYAPAGQIQLPQQAPPPMVQPTTVSPMSVSPRRKLTTKLLGLAAGLVIAVVIVIISVIPKKYTASSLTSYSVASYTASHPKGWADQTNNKKLMDKVMGSTSGLDDLKVFSYKISRAADTAVSVYLTASAASSFSDNDLRQSLASASQKASFEQGMNTTAENLTSNAQCASTSGKATAVKYDTNRYVAEINIGFDCKLSDSEKKRVGTDEIHYQIQIGAKNGKFFLGFLMTDSKDWGRNKTFYNNNMLPALNPKS